MTANSAAASLLLAALTGATTAYAQAPSALQMLTKDAFVHPNTNPPSGATTFTPASPSNLFTASMAAGISDPAQKKALPVYGAQLTEVVEKAYADYGYDKYDLGVSLGGFMETAWEISNGSFKLGKGDAQDQAKTRAAVKQMQNALLASPGYKVLTAQNKQLLYEACNFMMGDLVVNWQQAGTDASKKALVQQNARKQLQSLFGVSATDLARKPDGTFVYAGGAKSAPVATTTGGKTTAAPVTKKTTTPPVAAATKGPLPAASAHGAKIYIKYTVQPMGGSPFDQLILFPDGTAFSDIPSKPVSTFDEATLKASLKPYDIGTWKEQGNTLVLTFPGRKRDQVTKLQKTAKGWYDGDGKPDPDNAFNTYFPVIPLTPDKLHGAWKTESLTTMGMAGGGAPMVAAGSSGDRIFNSDGTFSGGKKSFASATTANMGDAFKSGGDVSTYSNNEKASAGRWRLDGVLITLEENGQRKVAPAFILPNWSKTGRSDIMIDGDWWKRPDGK